MPTRNRTRFLERAIDCFLAQDYPNKRLVIYEEESSYNFDTLPDGVVYHWSSDRVFTSIGAKRNAMCDMAGGDLIAHWDDDDWHAPNRLSTQVKAMQEQGARLCGLDRLVFYNGERAWLFQTVRKPWLAGGTFVYERSLWQEHPFTEVSNGEDVAFLDAAWLAGVPIATVDDPSLYVAVLHGENTTTREVDSQWSRFDVEQVRTWMKGSDHART